MLSFKKGDIIVFKAEDEWLSKAIAKLTDSDVCHAAIVYSDNSIVEVGANGIAQNPVKISEGDEAYVLRLTSGPDPAPLLASADHYLNARTRYDFPGLFLLAGLLLYHQIPLSLNVLAAANLILQKATQKLDHYLREISRHPDEPSMVCSQLIYQIYADCSPAYHIRIENGVFFRFKTENTLTDIRLADLLEQNQIFPKYQTAFPDRNTLLVSDEKLAEELYHALSSPAKPENVRELADSLLSADNSNPSGPSRPDNRNPLYPALQSAARFRACLDALQKAAHSPMEPEAMFITPADLVYHSINLKQVETLMIQRIH